MRAGTVAAAATGWTGQRAASKWCTHTTAHAHHSRRCTGGGWVWWWCCGVLGTDVLPPGLPPPTRGEPPPSLRLPPPTLDREVPPTTARARQPLPTQPPPTADSSQVGGPGRGYEKKMHPSPHPGSLWLWPPNTVRHRARPGR